MERDEKILPKEGLSIPKDAMGEIIDTLHHARIFIASREKMNPIGVDLYDKMLAGLEKLYG
jgi:hypothetical protein